MSSASNDRKLFKLILSAIASENLGPDDYQEALAGLRNGELVGIVEQILSVLAGPAPQKSPSQAKPEVSKDDPPTKGGTSRTKDKNGGAKSADQLFDDVKRRKITRNRLDDILQSLDSDFFENVDRAETMRNVIREFQERSTRRQWLLLDSIVNGNYENDPYLDSISSRS